MPPEVDERALRGLLGRLEVEILAVELDLRPPSLRYDHVTPDYSKFYCVFAGAGEHDVGGARHRLAPGDFVFVPRRTTHVDNTVGARTYRKWFCHFQASAGGFDLGEVLALPTVVPLGARRREALALFAALADAHRAGSAAGALRAAARFRDILALVIDALPRERLGFRWSPTLTTVDRVIARFTGALDVEHRLPDVAREVGVHPNHLSRLFTRTVGMPPHRYLVRLRLARARELLESTALPIQDIARRTGFADVHHFTRSFSAFFAIAPAHFRATTQRERSATNQRR